MTVRETIRRLGEQERHFREGLFLAPVLPSGKVVVRLAGILCELAMDGPTGWAVCEAIDYRRARPVRPAAPEQVRAYLRRWPAVRAILVSRGGAFGLGFQTQAGSRGIRVEGIFPIALVADALLFDTVVARFDGGTFLHEMLDPRRKRDLGSYLRQSLAALRPPQDLRFPGLTRYERAGYAWRHRSELEARKPRIQRRLERKLRDAGAHLIGYIERDGEVTVRYRVRGRSFTTVVGPNSLGVVSTGLPLENEARRSGR